jgi:AraC-like DNA-binding protein
MLGMRDKVEKVCRFLERNRFKKVTLKEAAAAIYVSPKYLSRIFRKYTKKGFNDYKLTVKMAAAKDLLATSGCTISQISYKLGYENTESFIRQFKKSVGPVPSAYRKKSQKKKLHKKR